MISNHISRLSAVVLLVGGAALLFAPDVVLPRLVPGYPSDAVWLGQLLAAAWLGLAALNWLQRRILLGGIYGRPTVCANLLLYFVSALSLLKAASRAAEPGALWALAIPFVALAVAYGWLLFRGPFASDLAANGG